MYPETKIRLTSAFTINHTITRRQWKITNPFWRRSALDFFGRNDAKAEAPVLRPPHGKSWPIGKDSDAGRDWGQKEKGTTEAEMAGWHHWLDGRESEWTPGDGDGQGGLACCSSWGLKESDTTEWLTWTELKERTMKFEHRIIYPPKLSFECESKIKTLSKL